jgi:hypothetical protein
VSPIPPRILEELYAVPPSQFTRVRNAQVADLRKARRPEIAEAVRRLRRPASPLWAVNQLGHHDPKRLAAFVEAVDRARRAQLHEPRTAGEALARQRAALEALVDLARARLEDNGLKASPAALRRISNTLQGAAVDRRRADALRHGRLTEELPAPGFDAFAGVKPGRLRVLEGGKPPAPEQTRAAERSAAREAARAQRQREREERERVARQQAEAAQRAQQDVDALAGQLAEARRRLVAARRGARRRT